MCSEVSSIEALEIEKNLLMEDIKSLYFKDDRVFSLGFSGGKDSSCTLAITLEALLEIPKEKLFKKLHILYSDTLMELLPVQAHTYTVLDNIRKFAKQHALPIEVMHAKPKMQDSMWSMLIAKGIRPPDTSNRWCTTRLKVNVQEDMLYQTFGTKDIETISIVGSRKDESLDRAQRLENNTLDGHLKGHSVFSKSLVFAPIEDFSTEDVWTVLRTSEVGQNVLAAEDLYALYATTNGEGAECQTILGNDGENGKNPGCGASQGRFGCWSCGLQYKKDKALVGMSKIYPYIKYLIDFRDWSVSIRDGQWETYRDFYNHANFTRLQYNIDNHRFGQTSPGGMSLQTRRETLERLLYAEAMVSKSIDFQLISDEELNFIQHRHLLEGDMELEATKIAAKYGRKILLSEEDKRLLIYSRAFDLTRWVWKAKVSFWYGIHADERFSVQFAKQMIEKRSHGFVKKIINGIAKKMDDEVVCELLKDLQLKEQFYPSDSMKEMIRREWREDRACFVTEALVRDYEETWDKTECDNYDPLNEQSISMEDKYAILDNWREYEGDDSAEVVSHPDYMRFSGNHQYIEFKIRKNKENEQKSMRSKKRKKVEPLGDQQFFSFAA